MHAPLTQVPVPVFLPAPLDSSQPSAAAEQKSKSPSDPLDADLLAMTDLVTEDEGKTEATSVNSEPPHGPRASVCVRFSVRVRQGTLQARDCVPARRAWGPHGTSGSHCAWPGALGFKQKLV